MAARFADPDAVGVVPGMGAAVGTPGIGVAVGTPGTGVGTGTVGTGVSAGTVGSGVESTARPAPRAHPAASVLAVVVLRSPEMETRLRYLSCANLTISVAIASAACGRANPAIASLIACSCTGFASRSSYSGGQLRLKIFVLNDHGRAPLRQRLRIVHLVDTCQRR